MLRRLFKTGNSVVLSLPKEVLEGLGIKEGESVNLELDREQRRVMITPFFTAASLLKPPGSMASWIWECCFPL